MFFKSVKNLLKKSELLTHSYHVHNKDYLKDINFRTIKYLYHRIFTSKKYKDFFPNDYENDTPIELHFLVSSNNSIYCIWTILSIINYFDFKPYFVIHSDGSLSEYQSKQYKELLGNNQVSIITKEEADQRISEKLENYPNIKQVRLKPNPFPLWLKLFDTILLNEKSPVMKLYVDSDILFLRPPKELTLNRIKKRIIEEGNILLAKSGSPVDVSFASDFLEQKGFPNQGELYGNSGVVGFKDENIDLKLLDNYIENLDNECDSWFREQAGWNILAQNAGDIYLPEDTYHIEDRISDNTVMKHFTGPRRFEFFLEGVPKLISKIKKNE